MSKRMLAAAILGCMVLSSGCATTEMHSFVDPDYREKTFNRIMVCVQLDKLDQRDRAETILAKRLAGSDVHVSRGLDVIPPTRQYDDVRFHAALVAAQVEGVLLVQMTDYYEDEYYVQPTTTTYSTGNLTANTYYYGRSAYTYGTGNSTSRTMTTGGYTYVKPRVRHEAELWDVETGKMAWIGGTFTRGNAQARFDHLMGSVANQIRKTLEAEGLVRTAVRR